MFVPLRRLAFGLTLLFGLSAALPAADPTKAPAGTQTPAPSESQNPAGTPETPTPSDAPMPVEAPETPGEDDGILTLWEALERPEELDVKFIAKDAKGGWLYVKNLTPLDVQIELPTAFVAEPQPPENRTVRRKDQTQVLGGGFSKTARSSQAKSEGARRADAAKKEAPRRAAPAAADEKASDDKAAEDKKEQGPIYLVRGKRSLHLTVACVCLEYGQPEPYPQIAYKLRPAETYTTQAELIELLNRYSRTKLPYEPVQAAAWHLANHLSWEELAAKRHGDEPLISKDGLAAGKKLVLEIEKHVRDNPPPQPQ